jgi:hypothetical protein
MKLLCIYFKSFEGSHALQPTSFKPPLNPFKILVNLTRHVPSRPTPAFVVLTPFWRSKLFCQ